MTTARRRHALIAPRRLPDWVSPGTLLWLVPLVTFGLVIAGLLASSLVPYRPFTLSAYRVTPETVCTGAPVRAMVTREFIGQISYLRLSESWITADPSGGFAADRPIVTEAAELPPAALRPRGEQTVPSPLITAAPTFPGKFRVRVLAEYQGVRFGFFPAIGSQTFSSINTITVLDCPPGGSPP